MSNDLYHNVLCKIALKAAVYTDTATGEIVDLQGYQGALITVLAGTLTTGTQTFKLTECATSGGSYTDVAATHLLGLAPAFIVTDDDTIKSFGYIGNKRYIKLIGAGTTTPSGTFGAVAILGVPLHAPTV